jgi:hypothetical protein
VTGVAGEPFLRAAQPIIADDALGQKRRPDVALFQRQLVHRGRRCSIGLRIGSEMASIRLKAIGGEALVGMAAKKDSRGSTAGKSGSEQTRECI